MMVADPGAPSSLVPARTALVAVVAAVAGLGGALLFGVSLNRLVHQPDAQGWNWDAIVGNPNSQGDQRSQVVPVLGNDHDVDGFSGIAESSDGVSVNGLVVPALAVAPLKGSILPPILEGRARPARTRWPSRPAPSPASTAGSATSSRAAWPTG